MARERVQVQGLGDAVPGISPTIQRGGQYAVQVQQAGRNKLMDLADALGQVNPMLQQYGQVQKIQFEKGAERGEMEAATADLDQAIEGLDATGEKLVEQGLMPRSQLVGYQRAYKRRIGQRQAKTLYVKSLNDRIQEVTQNLESDADIVSSIIAEERDKALQQLGQSPLAMQGFADFSDSVENNFYNNATKKRDRAVQDYNEGMIVEDFNQDFGEMLTAAESTPEDVAQLQLAMKSRMDAIAEEGKIPRSRVVELFWNGFAVPNVNNLLVGDDPQPDKAEKMLDSMLDIDLTGKGGKLGNINREGAYIRSKAVELRGRIESARRAVEQDEQLKARDIVDLYMPAALAVAGGMTGDFELDALQQGAVMQFLVDAGVPQEEAGKRAEQLIKSQDLNKLKILGLNYRYNDAKRDAWNAATGSILSFETGLIQKSQMVLPKVVAEEVIADITSRLEDDAGANVNEMLATGMGTGAPITDPRVKAEANKLSLQAKQNIWFEGTEAKDRFDGEFSKALDAVIDVDLAEVEDFEDILTGTGTAAKRSSLKSEDRTEFLEEYGRRLRDLQRDLVNDPNRDSKIIEGVKQIQQELTERWKDFKTLELEFEKGRLKELAAEELPTPPTVPDLIQAKENIDDVLNSWSDGLFRTYAPSIFGVLEIGPIGETGIAAVAEAKSKRLELQKRLFTADIPIKSKDREVAFMQADYLEDQVRKGGDYEGNTELINGLSIMRQLYGYRNPSEIKPEDASDIDFRFTPMYASPKIMFDEVAQVDSELRAYNQSPETLDIEAYPLYKKYNELFGISTVQHLEAFIRTQTAVYNKNFGYNITLPE
jgi:hypothetical protein